MKRLALTVPALFAIAPLLSGCVVRERRPPPPPVYDRHPAYLHALEDLRAARGHLQRPADNQATAWDQGVAIGEIDGAIHELKAAAIDDGKNLNEHPPIDVRMDWSGRLHRSLELLHRARQDCMHEEDNGYARGMQERAIRHIDNAIHFVEQGVLANHY